MNIILQTNRYMLFDAKGNFLNIKNSDFNKILSISKSLKQPNLICELIEFKNICVRYIHQPNNIIFNDKDHFKAVEAIIDFNITPNQIPTFEPIPEICLN